jgi:uncharacterized caspase-like protein
MIGLGVAPGHAEKRVALVIGNGAYKNAPALPNPRNDAQDVSAALQRAGFETVTGLDLDRNGMEEAAIRFARRARDADVALFYYSGHALQFAGFNYLIPVDAKLTDEADLRRTTRVDEIVADLQQAKNLRILVLDACRDNPLADDLRRSVGLTRSASMQRGLARVDTPHGMIIAYATQAGRTAADGSGRNSPYTAAFLRHIETPAEIGTVFRRISADVYQATNQSQLPELSLSLIGEFFLRGNADSGQSKPVNLTPAADPVVARVNGAEIRQGDIAFAEEDLRAAAEFQALAPEAKREYVITYLADVTMIAQVASKRNFAERPDFKQQWATIDANQVADKKHHAGNIDRERWLAYLRNKLLMEFALQEEAKAAITDVAMRQVYGDAVKAMGGEYEVRARHILVGSEQDARALRRRLAAGGDFDSLAKTASKDPGSAAEGGDLGYFTKEQMVPEFAEAAFNMAVGQISNPIKTQFGWHIIKLEDKRLRRPPDFATVKDQIETYLARKAQAELVEKLRRSASIERLDKVDAQKN